MFLHRIIRRLRALVQRDTVERELSDELRFHVDMETEKLMARGMARDDARRSALLTFGGVERYKEEARDVRGVRPLETVLQDLRYGARSMRKSPVFTIVVVLTLALGVGATTAIFSIVNAVLLRPLPYERSEELVRIYSQVPDGTLDRFSMSPLDYLDFRQRNRAFTDVAMWLNGTMTLLEGNEPERLSSVHGSENLFQVFGVRAERGRLFAAGDAERGDAIVLSNGLWVRRFSSDTAIVGRKIRVNGTSRTVVGVLPASFRFYSRDVDVWTPLMQTTIPGYENRSQHLLSVVARLRAGFSAESAQQDVRRVAAELAAEFPKTNEGWTANAFGIRQEIVGDVRRPLTILFASSMFVLLVACINVANLQLTRGASRARELAVRRAIGASRTRLVAQLLSESLALAVAGGVLGLVVGVAGMRALVAIAPEGQISRLDEVSLDGSVFAFTMLVSIATGLLFGLWPALRGSDPELGRSLRDGGRTSTGGALPRVRRALVIAEVSLALVLLVGAGLVLQSFARMVRVDLGIKSEQLVALRLSLPGRYSDSAQIPFHEELQRRLLARPGITTMSAADRAPVQAGGISTDIRLIERPDANDGKLMSFATIVVPDYFRTMGTPLLRGRDLRWNEPGRSIVVNEAAARRFWPGDNPLGKHIGFGRRRIDSGFTVVGVVADVRRGDITLPEEPMVYMPLSAAPNLSRTMTIVVRGTLGTAGTIAAARAVIRELDPGLPVYDVRTVDTIVSQTVAQPRLNTTLLSAFAALALVLAVIGIYGVVSFSVAQRTQELGVRMALGAQPADVFRLVVREGAILAVLGVGVGIVASRLTTPVLASWLYGIQPRDTATFVVVAAGLVAVAVLASVIPALRATRVDPVLAMRGE
jgi:predicted permease